MIRMSWIFSSGLTEAATIPSTCSSILRLKSEWRASSVRMFSASLMSFAASASTARADLRGLGHDAWPRRRPSRPSARRWTSGGCAASVSRTVLTFSSASRGAGAGGVGLGAGGAFLERLLVERDGLVHLRGLDRLLALHLQLGGGSSRGRCGSRRARVRRRCARAPRPRGSRSRPRAAPAPARSRAVRSTGGVPAARPRPRVRVRPRPPRRRAWRRSRPGCTLASAATRFCWASDSFTTRRCSASSTARLRSMSATSRVFWLAIRSCSSASSVATRAFSTASRLAISAASSLAGPSRSRGRARPARPRCVRLQARASGRCAPARPPRRRRRGPRRRRGCGRSRGALVSSSAAMR